MRKRAKVCDIVIKEDFEGGGRGGQIIPRRIRDWYQSFAGGGCSKAFVKSYLKVKGHCIREMPSRTRRLSEGREEETFDGEGDG